MFSLVDSLGGMAVGASFIYGAGAIYLRARGVEGMGFGDVKLIAMIGAFVGIRLTILTIFAASLAGSVFGLWTLSSVWLKRTQRRIQRHHETVPQARQRAWRSAAIALRFFPIPFGVFLGGMAMLALFFGNGLLRWYWRWL
ncbi:MAG: prepilin peptidase [Acidobacteriaceae bacterium]|nr:prepilin peptidase [Acidobacteriaceae bacterium]